MVFKQQKLLFKHHNMYFHTLFNPHIFSQNLNNITWNLLPSGPMSFQNYEQKLHWEQNFRRINHALP